MKLMVQSYNNGGTAWNAEAEETQFRSYTIDHQFNSPAKAVITLADPDATILQKYNADANDVYLGVGKVTIEDPTGTDIFYGRIIKAIGNTENKTVTLECRDWLDQLDEEQITYDMREDLDGAGLREYYVAADYDNDDLLGINCAAKPAAIAFIYFKGMNWAVDTHNGKYLVFTAGMAGDITMSTGPYTYTTTDIDTFTNDIGDLWTSDTDKHITGSVGGAWNTTYSFKVWVPESDWHVSSGSARIIMDVYNGSDVSLQLYNGATYDTIAENIGNSLGIVERKEFLIPDNLISGMYNNDGEVKIKLDDTDAGGIRIYYLKVECDFTTTGYSTATEITDGISDRLVTATDFSLDATKVWQGLPICIAKEIYLHIESATGPVLGGDNIVTLTCGVANVENTSGISTRQYKETTRLKILQDLAAQDKAVFWITLGGTTVTYKQTFGADTMQLTDGKVENWQSVFDYNQMVNEYHVYGARIGEYEIFQSEGNAASILKYKATRSKVLRNTGLVAEADAKAIGQALAARDAELSQMVGCTIAGNTATAAHATTIKLGEIVEITSSQLWPAAAAKDYVVTRWAYDSSQHKTYLTLHPKSSIGYQEIDALYSKGQKVEDKLKKLESDIYIAEPVTNVVS